MGLDALKNAAVLWRTRGSCVTIVAIPVPVVRADREVAEGSGPSGSQGLKSLPLSSRKRSCGGGERSAPESEVERGRARWPDRYRLTERAQARDFTQSSPAAVAQQDTVPENNG